MSRTATWNRWGLIQPEGPWFTMGADQIRALGDFVGDSSSTFRIEYRGGGYWQVMRLGSFGEPTEDRRMIFPDEPH